MGADKGTQFGDLLLQLVGALDDQPYDSHPLWVADILLPWIALVVLKLRKIRNEALCNVELALQVLLVELRDAAVSVQRQKACAAVLRDMERAAADRIESCRTLSRPRIRFIERVGIVAAPDQLIPAGELKRREGVLCRHIHGAVFGN